MSKFIYRSPRTRSKLWQQLALAALGILGFVRLFDIYNNNNCPRIQPTIGKVTMIYGNSSIYDQALETHELHGRRFNYPLFILRQPILDGTYNKYAILLSLLLQELEKPEGQRLEWLFWHDSDTVLMNPNMPLEVFLPPDHYGDVHILLTKDWNGMNNGVFFLRVHEWSVKLLSAAIAYPTVHPNVELYWPDQSALTNLFNENKEFAKSVVYCPLRWFNAYMRSPDGRQQNKDSPAHFQVHPGDLLVHFPGTPSTHLNETLSPYLQIAQAHEAEWEPTLDQTDYIQETSRFWRTINRQLYVPKHKVEPVPEIEVGEQPEMSLDPEKPDFQPQEI